MINYYKTLLFLFQVVKMGNLIQLPVFGPINTNPAGTSTITQEGLALNGLDDILGVDQAVLYALFVGGGILAALLWATAIAGTAGRREDQYQEPTDYYYDPYFQR